jgi:hypothetical protein
MTDADDKKPCTLQLIEGLQIMYEITKDAFMVDAEHDVLYAADVRKIPEDQHATLQELGWHVDSDVERFAFFT